MQKPATEIVFFDIDDTLYRKHSRSVPESALSAIKALRAKGIHTAIATGRTPAAIPHQLQELIDTGVFDILVSINGQYNVRFQDGQREILSAHPMDKNFIRAVTGYFTGENIAYGGVSDTMMSASFDSPTVRGALDGIEDPVIDPNHPLTHDVYQMLVFADPVQTDAYLKSGIHQDGYEILRWHDNAIDLVQKNGAKSQGIRDVCQALGIDIKNTMAFGDGLNDVEMLKTAGIGIAMGDAVPEAKASANYITGTIEEHGIESALKHFGLIA